MRKCNVKQVKCCLDKCTTIFKSEKEGIDHYQYCLFSLSECEVCGKNLMKKDLINHSFNCQYNVIDCINNCNMKILKKDIYIHMHLFCKEANTEC